MQSLEEVAICDVYPYERADGEPMNPRDFTTRESAEHIAGLAAQFKANRLNPGQPVMKPILYKEGGIYWIIDGECRVRAMRSTTTWTTPSWRAWRPPRPWWRPTPSWG